MPLKRCLKYLPLLAWLLAPSACVTVSPDGAKGAVDSPAKNLGLVLALNKERYLPGEAVLTAVTLYNLDAAPRDLKALDHESRVFVFYTVAADGFKDETLVEPVYSTKIPAGELKTLDGGASVSRHLLFTTLTFEPGEYLLQAIYSTPGQSDPDLSDRAYSRVCRFETLQEEPFLRRYLNGLITKEEAIRLAVEATAAETVSGEAKLVRDESGLYQWWVNLETQGAGGEKISYLVNPYHGAKLRRAKPFDDAAPEAKPPIPKDSWFF